MDGKGDLEQWTRTSKWDDVKTVDGKLTFEIKPEWQERDSFTNPGAQHSENGELRMPSPKLGCTCWTMKSREARVASSGLKKGRHAGPTLRTSLACTVWIEFKAH